MARFSTAATAAIFLFASTFLWVDHLLAAYAGGRA